MNGPHEADRASPSTRSPSSSFSGQAASSTLPRHEILRVCELFAMKLAKNEFIVYLDLETITRLASRTARSRSRPMRCAGSQTWAR